MRDWAPGVARHGSGEVQAPTSSLDDLSPRQREILLLHIHGVSRQEIAGRLQISSNTVRNHVQAIYERTGCANRIQTLRWALNQPAIVETLLGWLPDPAPGGDQLPGQSAAPVENGIDHSPAEIANAIRFFRDLVLIGEDERIRM